MTDARPASIRRRLLLPTLVALVLLLMAAVVASGFVLYRFVRAQVDGRLDAQIAALSSSLTRRPDGTLHVGEVFDGPPFDRKRAGWYWQISSGERVLGSRSLDGYVLDGAPVKRRNRDGRPTPGEAMGPRGEPLVTRSWERPVSGETIVATAPRGAILGPLREVAWALAAVLGGFALLLLGGLFVQVRLGLRPLDRLRADIAEVRSGRSARVKAAQPHELASLVVELNGLLEQNERGLERARGHVANLAHGLKTPLATLALIANEGGRRDPRVASLVDDMDGRVRHHLRRARAAALSGPARASTSLDDVIEDLRLTFSRLYPETVIATEMGPGLHVACDEQDVLEMLGNLVDNACKWSDRTVLVATRAEEGFAVVAVNDDGAGLDADQIEMALQPGRRLDERVAGSGFGLSITTELAELYGGDVRVARSAMGGLAAELRLPLTANVTR